MYFVKMLGLFSLGCHKRQTYPTLLPRVVFFTRTVQTIIIELTRFSWRIYRVNSRTRLKRTRLRINAFTTGRLDKRYEKYWRLRNSVIVYDARHDHVDSPCLEIQAYRSALVDILPGDIEPLTSNRNRMI